MITSNAALTTTIGGVIFRMNNLGVMGCSTCVYIDKAYLGDLATLQGSVSAGAAITDVQIVEFYVDRSDRTT